MGNSKSIDLDLSHNVGTKELDRLWQEFAEGTKSMPPKNAHRFLKAFAKVAKVEYNEKEADQLIRDCCSKENAENLDYEAFKLMLFTTTSKARIRVSETLRKITVGHDTYSSNVGLTQLFKGYTTTAYSKEEHEPLLRVLWERTFPNREYPGVPSRSWDDLGFQGQDPSSDFRGAGLCGLDALVALSEYHEVQLALLTSAKRHGIPFSTACLVHVNDWFDFLGWGFKSQGVPMGAKPGTVVTVLKLLFGRAGQPHIDPSQHSLANSIKVFHRFFIFGILIYCKCWEEAKATYMEFPSVQTKAREIIEEFLSSISRLSDLENAILKLSKDLLNIDLSASNIRIKLFSSHGSQSSDSTRNSRYSRRSVQFSFSSQKTTGDMKRVTSTPSVIKLPEVTNQTFSISTPLTPSSRNQAEAAQGLLFETSKVGQRTSIGVITRRLSRSGDYSVQDWRDASSDDERSNETQSPRKPRLVSEASMDLKSSFSYFPQVPWKGQSAYDIVCSVTPKNLPKRVELSSRRREEERRWIGNLIRSQLIVLGRMSSLSPTRPIDYKEEISKMLLQRRPREYDDHAWEIVDRIRAFCAFLDIDWDKRRIQGAVQLIAAQFE